MNGKLELNRGARRGLNILLGFALWTIYGVFSSVLTHYRTSLSTKKLTWWEVIYFEGSYAYAAGVLSPLVILLAKKFPLRRPKLARNLAVHVAGTFFYSFFASLIWDFANSRGAFYKGQFSLPKLFTSMDWGLDFAVLLYWIIVLLHYAVDYYGRYQAGLVEAADLNAQLARAQLQALKMQLHPHFLFNTLHAISELIHEDPSGAERMVVGLSQLLRLSLETSADIEVPLQQELRFVELYLDIERTRFETRLQVHMDIENGLRDALVPNLILQPLVENSIKHGIANRRDGGEIVLSALLDNGTLVLTVRDNGTGLATHGNGTYHEGVGLGTTRARLEKLYGRNQSLYFIRRPNAGAEVSIRLPLKFRTAEVLTSQ